MNNMKKFCDWFITTLILLSVIIVFAVTFDLPPILRKVCIAGEVFASFVFLMMLISSLLMYSAEHDAQPEVFRNAASGLWWAVATLTTVGYGDIYPVTNLGRLLGAFIAFSGIAAVAIPTGIITAGLTERLDRSRQAEKDASQDETLKLLLEEVRELKKKSQESDKR